MHTVDWRSIRPNLQATYGCQRANFHQGRCLNYTQNTRFRYPLSMAYVMLYCGERHPLLMKYFKTLIRLMRKMKGASSINCGLPLMDVMMSPSTNVNSQIAPKMSVMRYPLSSLWQMWYCITNNKERHSLLMKCFKPFLRCMRQMKRASESPYLPRLALTVSFSIVLGSQIAPKMPVYLPPYASV